MIQEAHFPFRTLKKLAPIIDHGPGAENTQTQVHSPKGLLPGLSMGSHHTGDPNAPTSQVHHQSQPQHRSAGGDPSGVQQQHQAVTHQQQSQDDDDLYDVSPPQSPSHETHQTSHPSIHQQGPPSHGPSVTQGHQTHRPQSSGHPTGRRQRGGSVGDSGMDSEMRRMSLTPVTPGPIGQGDQAASGSRGGGTHASSSSGQQKRHRDGNGNGNGDGNGNGSRQLKRQKSGDLLK